MSEEYISIDLNVIFAGLISGVVASLWSIIPFFVPGVANLPYITAISGIVLLFAITSFNRDKFIKSGILALITFFAISYVAVPAISGTLFKSNVDISQVDNKNLETVKLKLPNMACQGCARSIYHALKGIPGVIDAQVDLKTKSAVVFYDSSLISNESILSNEVIQAYGGYIE